MTADQLDEVIARAMWETWRASEIAPEDYRDFAWTELVALAEKYPDRAPGKFRDAAFAEARAVRQAISAAGMAVVPVEATPEITRAFIDADPRRRRFAATAKRDYRAMVRAGAIGGVDAPEDS